MANIPPDVALDMIAEEGGTELAFEAGGAGGGIEMPVAVATGVALIAGTGVEVLVQGWVEVLVTHTVTLVVGVLCVP